MIDTLAIWEAMWYIIEPNTYFLLRLLLNCYIKYRYDEWLHIYILYGHVYVYIGVIYLQIRVHFFIQRVSI